jgi:dTDP-glucose 4,6-dehydratase
MKKILITGGLGFIGLNLVLELLKSKNQTILNLDKISPYSNKINIKNKNYKFHKIDISKKEKLYNCIKNFKPDIIYHLAAESHVDRSIISAKDFIYSNIIGTYNLLETANFLLNKKKLSSNFRFIHVSTDEVYGSIKLGKFNENSNYKPNSPYSASKASSDLLVRSWFKTYNFPVITTNCSNNFGPYQNKEKLIPKIIKNIFDKVTIPIYGNGKNMRDWIFVDDHVSALIMVGKKGKLGENYNIGGQNIKSNNEIVKIISKIMKNRYVKFEPLDLVQYVKDRKGHDFRYAISNKKINSNLNWYPKYNFRSALELTIKWYCQNHFKKL